MRAYRIVTLILLLGMSGGLGRAEEPANPPRINKLLYMYNFFYFPFTLEFREGKTVNDILPFIKDRYTEPARLLRPEELQQLDREWNVLKEPWKKRSLLLNTPVNLGQGVRISQRLISHRIPMSRGAFDTIPITDRIQLNEALRTKTSEVQAAFRQLRFLKSFLTPLEEERFNFFIFSPSWCESSKEYRVLFETFLKTFPQSGLNLHSVVIEDPKEEIFDSRVIKELFPHPKKYTHDSVPRFLALEIVQGNSLIWEEGEALKELYERFLKQNRGYLNAKTTLFRSISAIPRDVSTEAPPK